MLRAVGPILACALMLAIVACAKRDPVDDEANTTAGLPAINDQVPNATGAPPEKGAVPAAETPAVGAKIPSALQGRWGLTPADCTTTRGDEKGLLIVTGDQLRFYESRAVPSADVQSDDNSISGDFTFTGEGQSWTRYESLKLREQELVRTETKPAASFTYAKCQ